MDSATTGGMPPAILLMGPTASGKTDLALSLAARFPLGIVSVDSALVFKDMDIGTAKPDRETRARFPHRLIDIITPEAHYSAARFREEASAAMAEITAHGQVPLLVGGTMLYFRALLEGLADLPRADPALRAVLDAEAREKGWSALHAELARRDPVAAARLSPTDSQRIQRALEICRLTGGAMTDLLAKGRGKPSSHRFLRLALLPSERAPLHERIAQRFRNMLANGLVEEVESLRRRYVLHADLPSMRCVGYRQTWACLEGAFGHAELADRGVFATRQLAKRQITWLTNSLPGEPFDCLAPDMTTRVCARVAEFLDA
ncbi:MAG: tRNA (adenosine(37)-N6)-dimethylallyltransferase MiaA [Zoogloeaceae bacterium]|jgi:tRNA dimethylallyltransferase|nr:tRNA (adenosine(37)-N6)-dimethylallyltransferase MiaA [Zoogloeaceae bacterium]